MGKLTVTRIDGSDVENTGVQFRRLGGVKANIRRGYQVEFYPYPREDGKWLVRVVKPRRGANNYAVDSYYEVIAKNQEEAEAFILKDGLWGGALAERIAARIGKWGEGFVVARMRGGRVLDNVSGKHLTFREIKQFQNGSDNGLDILARLARDAEPTPPPHAGDFVAFEVKSTLGAISDPPGLSAAQKNPTQFVESRLTRASNGTDGYPLPSKTERAFIQDALDALDDGSLLFRKVDVRMDHSGALAGTGGKPAMEFKTW